MWAGIDEAGRGPLAGPVVAAAVVLDPHHEPNGLNDSKKLSAKKRAILFEEISSSARVFGLATVSAAQIDEMNILRASLFAMRLAFLDLQSKISWRVAGVLVDGNQKAPLPDFVVQKTVVGGDALWPAIMAASILAKVFRDRIMLQYGREFPEYGFDEHKGYATLSHLAAIKRFGPCEIHRRSFAPVRECHAS